MKNLETVKEYGAHTDAHDLTHTRLFTRSLNHSPSTPPPPHTQSLSHFACLTVNISMWGTFLLFLFYYCSFFISSLSLWLKLTHLPPKQVTVVSTFFPLSNPFSFFLSISLPSFSISLSSISEYLRNIFLSISETHSSSVSHVDTLTQASNNFVHLCMISQCPSFSESSSTNQRRQDICKKTMMWVSTIAKKCCCNTFRSNLKLVIVWKKIQPWETEEVSN